MSINKFDDECPGCRPAVYDVHAKRALPEDHPVMQSINRVWAETTREEREAYHRVTCQNSREPRDMKLIGEIIHKITLACKAVEEPQILHS